MCADARYRPQSVVLVALFPHFPSRRTGNTAPKSQQWSKMHIVQQCNAILFAPLRRYQNKGLFLRLSNEKTIWVVPKLGLVISDNEELDFQALVRRGGSTFYPLRSCLMHRRLNGTIVRLQKQRTQRYGRIYTYILQYWFWQVPVLSQPALSQHSPHVIQQRINFGPILVWEVSTYYPTTTKTCSHYYLRVVQKIY